MYIGLLFVGCPQKMYMTGIQKTQIFFLTIFDLLRIQRQTLQQKLLSRVAFQT